MAVAEVLGSDVLPTRPRATGRTLPRYLIITFGRRATVPLTVLILAVTVWTWVEPWQQVVAAWGADYDFFRSVTDRWLATGAFYHPHQLAGPYEAAINVDTLYPPIALALFLPFAWLPAVLWWAIPLSHHHLGRGAIPPGPVGVAIPRGHGLVAADPEHHRVGQHGDVDRRLSRACPLDSGGYPH